VPRAAASRRGMRDAPILAMANQQQGNGRQRDDERQAARDRERMGPHWDDRGERADDRDDRNRSTEYYGQGQSGYAAGRFEADRSYGSRNQANPLRDQHDPDRGGDERFSGGRGGTAWRPEDRSMESRHPGGGGYGQGREGYGDQANYGSSGTVGAGGGHYGDQGNYRQSYDRGGQDGYLGQGGQQMGGGDRYERTERDSVEGRSGYNEGMYPGGPMQRRYGSQGYQGWGQQQGGAQQRGGVAHGTQGVASQHGWNEQGMRMSPGHRGKGPSGYTRSDDRIREIVCEVLMEDDHVDASNIEVSVKNGEVTLTGTVEDRGQKRMAEDCIEHLSCVRDVVNQLRIGSVQRGSSSGGSGTQKENGHSETQSSSEKRHRA
jgi:osmotically-inducible protein OsmY